MWIPAMVYYEIEFCWSLKYEDLSVAMWSRWGPLCVLWHENRFLHSSSGWHFYTAGRSLQMHGEKNGVSIQNSSDMFSSCLYKFWTLLNPVQLTRLLLWTHALVFHIFLYQFIERCRIVSFVVIVDAVAEVSPRSTMVSFPPILLL